ncbi:MAG TPA: 3-hydroxyacyl-CoA dehydrogenase NAD-binding domain-containing protein [Candidatus Cybelea sp.]|nr:3-hydroxyacyl-CoA dehydrogenase NAD-binding domain-containing protein [Candidatus Cybelea sp.]
MPERVMVVGGGTMGAGIALVAAGAGFDVTIVEPQASARERAVASFAREAERSGDASPATRIEWADRIEPREGVMLAIEAVPERFELKREVFLELAKSLPAEALLATNTSSFSVAELADVAPNPARVIGLHFFNPPARMRLVEIVRAEQTAQEAIDRAFEFVERCGKTPVLVGDTPGFIVNRVARPYYLQALRALERGVASVPELDALARSAGFAMGPFELMDLIGLDVNLATTESVYQRTEAARLEPAQTQRIMVAEGLLGRKTRQGFYSYADGKAKRFEPEPAQIDEQPNADEIVAIVGFGVHAQELAELIGERYASVQVIANDEMLDEVLPESTIIVDAGDGASDRSEIIAQLDAAFEKECIIIADAYATNLSACARRMRHGERLVGFGALGSVASQSAVEIVNSEEASDDALELAQELFASIGKAAVLVEDVPGLFLGRTIGSIVNEAMIAVAEDVASPQDVDEAMMLGANYPGGPIAWGREIGGTRVRTILKRLADAEGDQFAPHRSLWLLDVEPAAPETPE